MSLSPEPRARIKSMSRYFVKPHRAEIILDANESPWPSDPAFSEKIARRLASIELNRYPDPSAIELKERIAAKHHFDRSEISLGNGSDELIAHIIGAYVDPGEIVMTLAPTFSIYRQIARIHSSETVELELDERFRFDLDEALEKIERLSPKVIFIARPNNPDGSMIDRADLTRLIDVASSSIVALDEAYIDYADQGDALDLIGSHGNLLALRTFSKIGFAGARLGYLMAPAPIIEQIEKTRLPFNVGSMSQAVGIGALEEWGALERRFEIIKSERARLYRLLEAIEEIEPFESEANFLLIRVKTGGDGLFRALLDRSIRVRRFEPGSRLRDHLRITIGSPRENDQLISALREIFPAS